ITGWPYLAKMTSPCSVTLNDPLTEPGACASTARPAGPPPRPSAPPRPWNRVSRTPWAVAHWASLAWGVEQPRGGAGRPEFLGRVRVPEHRLELPAVGGDPLGDVREREHAGQHVRRVGHVSRALTRGNHVERGNRGAVHGVSGELVDRSDVIGRTGEAH